MNHHEMTMRKPLLLETRCGIVEKCHYGVISVCDQFGYEKGYGDTSVETPMRSTAKPFFLIALLNTIFSGIEFSLQEIAIMSSSHNGEPVHVEAVKNLLHRFDISESALKCGVHEPYTNISEKTVLSNQCSGKHAMFLIANKIMGINSESYKKLENPVNRILIVQLEEIFEQKNIKIGLDGCSILNLAFPVRNISKRFADFSSRRLGQSGEKVLQAYQEEAYFIGGKGCLDTFLNSRYKMCAKAGSDGIWVAGVPSHGIAITVKTFSGDELAAQRVIVECLDRLMVLPADDDDFLSKFKDKNSYTLTGEISGEVLPCFQDFLKL
jgi:L-asparaginase II